MRDENNDFSVEKFLKKIQDGDNSLLVIGAILVIVPAIFLFFLIGGKEDKKITQQKLRQMTRRKNVFNFASKTDDGKKVAPRSSLPKSNSNWFGAKTEEQQIADELKDAMEVVEKSMMTVRVPPDLVGDARLAYEAEHNYFLCMGNGAIEERKFDEAEKYLFKAIENARDNYFLLAYTYGSLCHLYETSGDKTKLQEAYKKYFEAVKNLPPEYGGADLNSFARNAYMALKTLNEADSGLVAQEISNHPLVKSGVVPSNINVKDVFKDLPLKYD